MTHCSVTHLTSFGSGYFPEPNTIDFEFVFADADFSDNMTIYMTLLITTVVFLVTMIWAGFKDHQDVKKVNKGKLFRYYDKLSWYF